MRPDRVPWSATHVVKASPYLPWGAKAVWLELQALDNGPEGAWISAKALGARLGLNEHTVKKHRTKLMDYGLLEMEIGLPRRRTSSWFPALPADCIPRNKKLTPESLEALAGLLDARLTGAAHGTGTNEGPAPHTVPVPVPTGTAQYPNQRPTGTAHGPSEGREGGGGGRGGSNLPV